MMRKNKRGNPVIIIAILILVLVLLYSGLQILESTVFNKPTTTDQGGTSKTIVRDGVEYFPRQDVTIVLLSGIDQTGPMEDSGSYNNSGEADMVSLLIFDEKEQKLDILSLNRDTMMDIPVLGLGGKPAGTIWGQLALAHTYGSGLEDSSENLRDAVSDFLYDAHIDYYLTMNMDAIALLNDAVGGVTVTVTDDFSEIDPSIHVGEVTLQGQQAVHFVQSRQNVGDELNLTRMERQKEYMTGFMDALKTRLDTESGFVSETYEQVADYMVTDCSVKVVSSLIDRYGDYELGQILTVEGENVKGKTYMEYHVDEAALDRLILQYLYAPKK